MKISPRRRSREFAVQALYQAAINDTAAPEIAANIRESRNFHQADDELFTQIFSARMPNASNTPS